MDTFWIFVTVLGTGLFIWTFSVVFGAKLERWRDKAGLEPQGKRTSTARSSAMLGLVIGGATVGSGFLILGGVWIVLGAVLVIGGLVSGIVIGTTGKEPPERPAPTAVGHYEGFAYFWHCWLPQKTLDGGRAIAYAFVAPIGAIVLLVLEKWVGAAIFGGLALLSWTVLLAVKSRNVPQTGPCARAE